MQNVVIAASLALLSACAFADDTPLPLTTSQDITTAATVQPDRGISANEPVYFIVGDNPAGLGDSSAKFQLSLKYRLLNPVSPQPQEQRWWEQLYFGYTQTSVWDIQAKSAPFEDTSYRPSLFYERQALASSSSEHSILGIRTGLEHESNGRDGSESRSINTVFFRPTYAFPAAKSGYVLSLSPKFYAYIEKSDNPDIANYRGYADYALRFAKPDSWGFEAIARKGMDSTKGSLEMNVTYPFRGFLRNVNGAILLQYFDGYGETILDYNIKEPAQLRLGLIVAS